MESEMTESQADEEVAVTKRGRAVKLPAKYKAEVCPCTAACLFAQQLHPRGCFSSILYVGYRKTTGC